MCVRTADADMAIYNVTSSNILQRVAAPNLPFAPDNYNARYQDQLNNVLRLYFNRLEAYLGQLMATAQTGTPTNPLYVAYSGGQIDAFGRLRVSSPATIFDSQNRYDSDPQFDTSTSTGGTATFLTNESSVALAVTTSSGSEVVRQTYRVMPYQPGKSLFVLATFAMNTGKTNLRQRVGFFNTNNGVYFQQDGVEKSFVIRTYTSGSVDNSRKIVQSEWNGDKLDGTGPSGLVLDPTKTQILFLDFEWLGVGSVRCGFVIDGEYIVCHTFNNANSLTSVYMQTAILPIRYEITNTGATASSSTMKQICSSVMSEGGYEQKTLNNVARMTSALSVGTSFVPLISIRLASDSLGAVVLPSNITTLGTTAGDFEVALFKNATLTGASYNTTAFAHVDYDVTATALTGGTIIQTDFISSSNKTGAPLVDGIGYNFSRQLGVSLAGVSDVLTLAARTLSGTNSIIGAFSFIDLTA